MGSSRATRADGYGWSPAASRCAEQPRHGESHAVQPGSPGGANDDRRLPPDNNRVERQICPVALQRANQLFVGSLRAGQRAVSVMSLVRSAWPNANSAADRVTCSVAFDAASQAYGKVIIGEFETT